MKEEELVPDTRNPLKEKLDELNRKHHTRLSLRLRFPSAKPVAGSDNTNPKTLGHGVELHGGKPIA